ncbi:MAG: hypothetical protein JKX68_10830 [Flavobacteriales bacterium]|nr:hypothetical protein [Flavobacteriales bacterium]
MNRKYTGLGIALCVGIGTAIGIAIDNLTMGIAMVIGVGLPVWTAITQKRLKEEIKKNK